MVALAEATVAHAGLEGGAAMVRRDAPGQEAGTTTGVDRERRIIAKPADQRVFPALLKALVVMPPLLEGRHHPVNAAFGFGTHGQDRTQKK